MKLKVSQKVSCQLSAIMNSYKREINEGNSCEGVRKYKTILCNHYRINSIYECLIHNHGFLLFYFPKSGL